MTFHCAIGIRNVTRLGYRAFAGTMLGRAVFGLVGRRAGKVLDLGPKALRHASNVGRLEVEKIDDSTRCMKMIDAYCFNEPWCIGLAEGALQACKREYVIAQRRLSLTSSEYFVHWH